MLRKDFSREPKMSGGGGVSKCKFILTFYFTNQNYFQGNWY